MNMNGEGYGIESKIRVKSGDLAAKGKGTMAIIPMPEGLFQVGMSLPDETGVCNPLDLTTVERVELVKTKIGWFNKGEWITPLLATTAAVMWLLPAYMGIAYIALMTGLAGVRTTPLQEYIFFGGFALVTMVGPLYTAGIYTGTKLTRLARFILTTQDGRYAVLEGPESVFRFISGVYAAPNIQLEVMELETPPTHFADPQSASA